ncbi:MAG: Ig-like domain-containing protein, partial [Candidatus Solibacter usitatus]|nr:Ig-like domain-containing protein [Candidatus Solibacter usitatus]
MHIRKRILLGLWTVPLLVAGAASAQSLVLVSGDGQVMVQNTLAPEALVVKLLNAAGQPMPNQPVAWTVTGNGGVNAAQSTTDTEGLTQVNFVGSAFLNLLSYVQSTVTATAFGQSVNFTMTISAPDQAGGGVIQAFILYPTLPDLPLVVGAGAASNRPIRVFVSPNFGPQTGQGVPRVAVRVLQQTLPGGGTGPTINCGGPAYTAPDGVATCNPVVTGLGPGLFSIFVGGQSSSTSYRFFSDLQFRATKGPLATLRISAGNNQQGNAGARLAAPLVAIAEDLGGNAPPEPRPTLIWEPVTPNTVTLFNATTLPDDNGRVSANVTLGNVPGNVQIRVRDQTGTISAIFTATVTLNFTGFRKISGDGQDAIVNTDFPQPLVVEVSTDRGAVANIPVQFTLTSGSAVIPTSAVLTDANGRAQITVRAGASAGPIVITAALSGFATTATFNLTSRPPGPSVSTTSFVSAAGGPAGGGVSPLALVAMYGGGLGTGLQGCRTANLLLGPMPFQLASVSVQFGSTPAPLYAVCNLGLGGEFAVLQVPADQAPGLTTVVARVGIGSTTVNGVQVSAVSPGLFETIMSDGQR